MSDMMLFDQQHDARIGFGEATVNTRTSAKPAALRHEPSSRAQLVGQWHRSAQEREDRMNILMVSTPATGHINPLLGVARVLIAEGHNVVCLSGSALRDRIESAGAGFRALPPAADFDLNDPFATAPELKVIPPGLEWLRVALERLFIERIVPQHEGMHQLLRDFPADVIIGDDMMFGVLPMLLGPRANRPPVVLCGTSFLHWCRDDGAPHFVGLPPATTDAERTQYAAIAEEYSRAVDQPAALRLNKVLEALGVGPLSLSMFDSVVALADAYMQLTVPGFEFPRELPPTVNFIGTLPIISEPGTAAALGARAGRLAQSRARHAGYGGQPRFRSVGRADARRPCQRA